MAKFIQFKPGNQTGRRALKKAGRQRSKLEEAGQLNMFDQRHEGQVIRTYSNAFVRALQLDEQGSDDAISAYEEAVSKNVRPADALCNIATIYMDRGLTLEAIDTLSRALVVEPRHALAHYNLGNVYLDSGSLQLAQLHYEQALRIESDFAEVYFNLALVLIIRGDRDRGIDMLKKYESMTAEQVNISDLVQGLGTS